MASSPSEDNNKNNNNNNNSDNDELILGFCSFLKTVYAREVPHQIHRSHNVPNTTNAQHQEPVSEIIEEGSISSSPPPSPPSPPSAAFRLDTMNDTTTVYFGWIKHPATKAWRTVIKEISDNSTDYPTWSDDICEQVREKLQDKGIRTFLVNRDQSGLNDNDSHGAIMGGHRCRTDGGCTNNRGAKTNKKINDKLHSWDQASDKEILEKTRQCFINHRKKQRRQDDSTGSANKRPRGRPPKKSKGSHNSIMRINNNNHASTHYCDLETCMKQSISTMSLISLRRIRFNCHAVIQQVDALEGNNKLLVLEGTNNASSNNALSLHGSAEPKASSKLEVPEQTKMFLHDQLEMALQLVNVDETTSNDKNSEDDLL